MSADSGSDATSADIAWREKLKAVPVIDLRPVIDPQESATRHENPSGDDVAQDDAIAADAGGTMGSDAPPDYALQATRSPFHRLAEGRGWLVPFLAGTLFGAGAFYLALWLQALT